MNIKRLGSFKFTAAFALFCAAAFFAFTASASDRTPPTAGTPGSWGFGAGIESAVSATPFKLGGIVTIRYWLDDKIGIQPALKFNYSKQKNGDDVSDETFDFTPAASLLYKLYKGASTDLIASAGLGFNVGRDWNGDDTDSDNVKSWSLILPTVGLSVEHRFNEWLAVNLGFQTPIFFYTSAKVGDGDANSNFQFGFDSTVLMLTLFVYTD